MRQNMRKINTQMLRPLLAAVLGVGLGFLRGKDLLDSFDLETGLQTWDRSAWVGGLTAAMLICSIAVAAVLCVFALISRPGKGDYATVFSGAMLPKSFMTAGGLLLVAAAIADFASGAVAQVSRIVLALLSAFAGIALVLSLIPKLSRTVQNFCTLVPPSFCCYLLIIVYRDRTSNPIIWTYAYEMIAVVLAAIMFYQSAGFAFGVVKPRRTYLISMLTLTFAVAVTVGAANYAFTRGEAPNGDAPMVAYTAALAVCALGSAFALSSTSHTVLDKGAESE